jgi:hypothetical protein
MTIFYYFANRHIQKKWFFDILKYGLIAMGSVWLVTEVVSFFSAEAQQKLASNATWFSFLCLVVAFFLTWQNNIASYKLRDRDILIKIAVADALRVPGVPVIPTDTTFNMEQEPHGTRQPPIGTQFTEREYNSEVQYLEGDIQNQIDQHNHQGQPLDFGGVSRIRYQVGTVIPLQKNRRHFFLLALTDFDDNAQKMCTEAELSHALEGLWNYIDAERRKTEIVIPVIGTGHAGLNLNREEVVRRIILSFIASCADGSYCDKLTIALYPPDVTRYKIDFPALSKFLEFSCRYPV